MGADDSDKPMSATGVPHARSPARPFVSANDPGVEVRQGIADVRRYSPMFAAGAWKDPRED